MQGILSVTIPFFALVLAGYVAAWRHVLPESAIPGLNAFVLYFALPCMLLRFGLATPIGELLNPLVMGLYLVAAMAIVFFTVAVSLDKVVGMKDAAFGALVAAFPNTGFMGVSLMTALLGPAAAGPLVCVLLADVFVTSAVCIGLAQAGDAREHGMREAMLRALRGAIANPMPWAIALGAALRALDIRLLGPIDTGVRMLADAATPVALFTIGAVLWRAGQHAQHRTAARRYLPQAMIKLLLHPLLVFLLAAGARGAGAAITPLQITVMTLAAALPSAANVSMLAERYGADNGRIARIIMTSTTLAFASFSLLAWAFGVRAGS